MHLLKYDFVVIVIYISVQKIIVCLYNMPTFDLYVTSF
jgi:hypothetical protein